jgi:hypothetical protein
MRSMLAIVAFFAIIAMVMAQGPAPNPVRTNCSVGAIAFYEDNAGVPGAPIDEFAGSFVILYYNRTLASVLTSPNLFGAIVMGPDSRANYTFEVNDGPATPPQTWPNDDPVPLTGFLTGCNVTNVVTIRTFQRADPNNFRDENCSYVYIAILRSPDTCCTGVCGDPQFKGLRGQSFQVHGIDGAVYNLISASDFSVNSEFRFLTGPRACPIIPTTGKRSVACWSHDGSYLGNLAIVTAAGERILIQSGDAKTGFSLVTVDGKALGLNEVVSFSKGSIVLNSTHEVTVSVGQFEIEVENNNDFLNLRSVRVAASEWHKLAENGGVHGLLGQTWQNKRYSGKVKEIEGDVDDYVIESNDVFSHEFVHSRFIASQ